MNFVIILINIDIEFILRDYYSKKYKNFIFYEYLNFCVINIKTEYNNYNNKIRMLLIVESNSMRALHIK